MKKKNVLFCALFLFNSILCFSFGNISISQTSSKRQDFESVAISKEINKNKKSDFVLVSRDANYPTSKNSVRNLLNYNLTEKYANGQKAYLCASPYSDIQPIVFVGEKEYPISGLSMNYCMGNSEVDVSYYGLKTIFKNNIFSSKMEVNQIYISQDLADIILKSRSLSNYSELIDAKFDFKASVNKSSKMVELKIADVLTRSSSSLLQNIYGPLFVVGGYKFAVSNGIDGFEMHTIMPDNYYSNRKWLSFYYQAVENELNYKTKYVSFTRDANPSPDLSLININSISTNRTFTIIMFIAFGLSISIEVLGLIFVINKDDKLKRLFLLFMSGGFFFSILILKVFLKIFPFSTVPILFNSLSVLILLSVGLMIVTISVLIDKPKETEDKEKV